MADGATAFDTFLTGLATLFGFRYWQGGGEASGPSRKHGLVDYLRGEENGIIPDPVESQVLSALYFINHQHATPYFSKVLKGEVDLATSGLMHAYNRTKVKHRPEHLAQDSPEWWAMAPELPVVEVHEPAFENFKNAFNLVLEEANPTSIQQYYEIHRRATEGGIEGVRAGSRGTTRPDGILLDFTLDSYFTRRDVKVLKSNPYVTFRQTSVRENQAFGYLIYPDPRNLREPALRRVAAVDPQLAREIKEYQSGLRHSREWQPAPQQLTRRTLEALVLERIAWFQRERAKLGATIHRRNLDTYTRIVAEYYRDLVSIHPFEDCNGRSTRTFALYGSLIKEGFPPPRLENIDQDFTLTIPELAREIRKGIERSEKLYQELRSRGSGLPLEDVARIYFPDLPDQVDGRAYLASLRSQFDPHRGEMTGDGGEKGSAIGRV